MTDRQTHRSTSTPLFGRPARWAEVKFVADALRTETVGGALLILGAAVALIWANSPWSAGYEAMREATVGPSVLGLDLDLSHWAADGLLAIFFFVVGVELKREMVVGDLRSPARAAVPILAAVGGMAMPAVIYVLVNLGAGDGALRGWAIPTATDIAFAVAVLAVVGSHLPSGLRSFLLTLAVVDDLLAITIIAIFYTDDLNLLALAATAVPIVVFAVLVQRRITKWWLLIPLAVVAWALMYRSGIHATIAGVVLGFTVPAMTRRGEQESVAERFEHRWRPVSAGVAVPVFALFAAGVNIGGAGGLGTILADTVAIGVILGLVLGKLTGVLGTTFVLAKLTRAELDADIKWVDMLGVALLAGIGFTVSLLIGELAFGIGSARDEHVKAGILAGSLIAAILGSAVLLTRNRHYRRIYEDETRDTDADSVPDLWDAAPDDPKIS
ncbi:MAG TPA: Na+/H+ antiporter NhaA [Actinomycetales bacterium]|nr:Na+/H+ antiporter NhaA [Actinomycetales bacterium]